MRAPTSMIPQEMVKEYNILPLVNDGMVLAEIIKGIYGLPQAGHISYNKLFQYLKTGEHIPTVHTPYLFKHRTRPIFFCLVVDDVGVKYTNRDDA